MKKLILSAMTIATIMISCKKEGIKDHDPSVDYVNKTPTKGSAARVVPQGNMEDYIVDAKDPQNERINKALYGYMLGMRKVFETDPTYLQQALALAKTTSLKTINLHEFICQSSACKIIFNGELCLKYPEKGTAYDHCVQMVNDMDYKAFQEEKDLYEPGMYIVNASTADLNQGYYLALGNEVVDADENHDYIAAWHIMKNGTTRLELINEQQANQSKEPIVIFNPVGRYLNTGSGTGTGQPPVYNPPVIDREPFVPPLAPAGNNFVGGTIQHDYVHIDQHYEGSGPSQYSISYVISDGNGSIESSGHDVHLADVPTNFVNCWCSCPLAMTSFFDAPAYNTVMTFVTFEYDWFATPNYITPGGNFQVSYKSHLASEVYKVVGNSIIGTLIFDGNGVSEITSSNNQVHAIKKI